VGTKDGQRTRVRVGPLRTTGRCRESVPTRCEKLEPAPRPSWSCRADHGHAHRWTGFFGRICWCPWWLGRGAAWCLRCCRWLSWAVAFVLAQWFAPAVAWPPLDGRGGGAMPRIGGGFRARVSWLSHLCRCACWPLVADKLMSAVGLRPCRTVCWVRPSAWCAGVVSSDGSDRCWSA